MGSLRSLHVQNKERESFLFPWKVEVSPGDPVHFYRHHILSYGTLHSWRQSADPHSWRDCDLHIYLRLIDLPEKNLVVVVFEHIDADDGDFSWYWSISIPRFKTRKALDRFSKKMVDKISLNGFYGLQEIFPDFPHQWMYTYDSNYITPEIGERADG